MFEYTAVCAFLAAWKPLIGMLAAGILMLIPLALAIGNGLIALILSFLACAAVENLGGGKVESNSSLEMLIFLSFRPGLIFLLTIGICAWVHWRANKGSRGMYRVFPPPYSPDFPDSESAHA